MPDQGSGKHACIDSGRRVAGVLKLRRGGAEQNARLTIPDALNPTDDAKHFIKCAETVANDLGNQIPLTVRRMQCADFGNPAKSTDDLVSTAALHRDEHDRAHRIRVAHISHPHRESDDHAALDEPVDPTVHCRPGHSQSLGQIHDRFTTVRPQ